MDFFNKIKSFIINDDKKEVEKIEIKCNYFSNINNNEKDIIANTIIDKISYDNLNNFENIIFDIYYTIYKESDLNIDEFLERMKGNLLNIGIDKLINIEENDNIKKIEEDLVDENRNKISISLSDFDLNK